MLTVGFSSTIMSRVAEEVGAPFFTTTLKHITSIAVPLVDNSVSDTNVQIRIVSPKKTELSLPSTCRSEVNQRVSERDNRDDSEKVHSF